MSAEELNLHIQGCARNRRESQKAIYEAFYGYGMSVCLRYVRSHDDAIEVYNDSFLKIFREIWHYRPAYANELNSFRGWIRKIMIYTAIDHTRKHHKHSFTADFEASVVYLKDATENVLDRISYEEILAVMQRLSPAYRTVLNLYVIDGFTHEEIAAQLGITTGTSKSNLFKARQQLQHLLKKENELQISKNVG